MRKKTPAASVSSMPTWETLEEFVRTKIQATMQAVLEDELTEPARLHEVLDELELTFFDLNPSHWPRHEKLAVLPEPQ